MSTLLNIIILLPIIIPVLFMIGAGIAGILEAIGAIDTTPKNRYGFKVYADKEEKKVWY